MLHRHDAAAVPLVLPSLLSGLRIVVLIPTRNRASLAIAAIDSVLASEISGIDVVVSDNSTDELDIVQLAAACEARSVRRIRPAQPMAMAEHWDWALREVLKDRHVSHIAVLTDRMMFMPRGLLAVAQVVAEHRDAVVTYGHDGLSDDRSPMELYQLSWTGRLLEVPARVLQDMAARSMHGALESVVPRLLNGVTPRDAIESVLARFRSICADAIAPDYAFAYRYVAIGAGILHYDRPVLLSYGYDRSNGTSARRGRLTADHADFLAGLDDRGVSYAAPLPGAPGAMNVIVHEYCAVREKVGVLPPIDLARYAQLLATEAGGMDPGPIREALEAAVATLPQAADPPPMSSAPRRPGPRWGRRLVHGIRSPRWALSRLQARRPRPDRGYQVTPAIDRGDGIARAKTMPRPPRSGPSNLELVAPVLSHHRIRRIGRIH
jgi:hypothetical protein